MDALAQVLPKPTAQSKAQEHQSAIENLQTLLKVDLEAVNAVILEQMNSKVDLIPTLAGYLIQAGGKRLRPLITLAAARLVGYEGEAHRKLAATVEFIHTATLLHDDVVDGSDLRRGQRSANLIWGNEASVLVGDFLFARAFNLMVDVGNLNVLEILSSASSTIAEGEVMQLANTSNLEADESTYLEIISSKTAALFSAASEVSAIIANCPEKEQAALRNFGYNLGIAFQLVDDALDYSGRQASLGKSIGDDFRDGKCTLPVLLAYQQGSEQERLFWKRTIQEKIIEDQDILKAISILTKYNTLETTIKYAESYIKSATEVLTIFPKSAYRTALIDVAEFCVSRAH